MIVWRSAFSRSDSSVLLLKRAEREFAIGNAAVQLHGRHVENRGAVVLQIPHLKGLGPPDRTEFLVVAENDGLQWLSGAIVVLGLLDLVRVHIDPGENLRIA